MQRKIIIFQVIMLGITMALGLSLKSEAFETARAFHRTASLITLVTSLFTMIIIVSQKATSLVTTLVIVAFAATLMASVGGNLTRTSRHELGYFMMIASFAVAMLSTFAAVIASHPVTAADSDKKP